MNEIIITTETIPTFANKELNTATRNIFKIGETVRKCAFGTAVIMAHVDETECYKEDGFNTVHEWAMKTFGFKKSASYTLLKIGHEYVEEIRNAKGTVTGYKSNLLPDGSERDFTTTQIEKMLPVEHEIALELVTSGEITPEMTCKEIEKVIKKVRKGDEPEPEETTEPEPEETAEPEPDVELVRVTDENGTVYEIPRKVLEQYRVDE